MPIRIDYSPTGTLMNLARSAGEAQEAQASSAHDLAFTQMAMQAQTQNAQIGATIRRNDQAFQLQHAAMARQARTPTRAAPSTGPVAQEIDQTLRRQVVTREWEQQDTAAQIEQIEVMRASGQYSDKQIEAMKLGALGGRSTAQLLKEQEPEREGLTQAQTESVRRQTYQQQRGDLESERERLLDKEQFQGWQPTPAWQKHLDKVVSRIQALDAKYAAGGGGARDPKAGGRGGAPQPMPASKADAVPGTVYVEGNTLWRWDGNNMNEISTGGK